MSEQVRRPLVAGNWKLHKTLQEARQLASELVERLTDLATPVEGGQLPEVVVAPVFTALSAVAEAIGDAPIGLAAQHCHWEPSGAFTGEVSPALLRDAGCSHVIVGHSERRQLFGETDDGVNRKVRAVLAEGLTPIVCVGETLQQRQSGETMGVVAAQVQGALAQMTEDELARVVLAYEPVWAIGTGETASPEDAQEVHGAIRSLVESASGSRLAQAMRILYGGSVKPANAAQLMAQRDIDGALVGGASLDAESFAAIVAANL